MTSKSRSSKTKPLSEAHIQATCTAWLELDGWYGLRTDPVSRKEWGKGFGESGMADYQYARPQPRKRLSLHEGAGFWYGALVEQFWVEWKKKNGKAKEHQVEWKRKMQALGFLVVTAGEEFDASIEGFAAWYRKSGLQRKDFKLT